MMNSLTANRGQRSNYCAGKSNQVRQRHGHVKKIPVGYVANRRGWRERALPILANDQVDFSSISSEIFSSTRE